MGNWTKESCQGMYFELTRSSWPDYPNGVWQITGLDGKPYGGSDDEAVAATHIETGTVKPLSLSHLGAAWLPIAFQPPGNTCAECGDATPPDDYLCEDCRG